jgi:hypothetical protein
MEDYPKTESAKYGDIEVRAPDGVLDEIVGTGTLHLEQLSDGAWWFSFTDKNGHCIHCNLWGTGVQIEVLGEIEHQVVGRVEYEGRFVPAPKGSGRKWDIER